MAGCTERLGEEMLSVNHLDVQLCGQNGSHGAAQVPQQAVREGDQFPHVLSPTSAPLAHEPQIFNRGFNVREKLWNSCRSGKLLTGSRRAATGARTRSRGPRGRRVWGPRHGTNRPGLNPRRTPAGRTQRCPGFLPNVRGPSSQSCMRSFVHVTLAGQV